MRKKVELQPLLRGSVLQHWRNLAEFPGLKRQKAEHQRGFLGRVQKAAAKRKFLSPIGFGYRRAQKAERSEVFCAQICRQARRAQKEIIEFSLLSLSAFMILTLVAMMFGKISEGIKDSEIKNSLSAAASDLAFALAQADILADRNPESNFTLFLRFPRELSGASYEISFSKANDSSCRIGNDPPSCVRAFAGGKVAYYPVKLSRSVLGEIFGSSAELAAVTYNSNDRMNLALSVG
ncbi:MAG: hypothetical protein V1820_06460 [archaeon]